MATPHMMSSPRLDAFQQQWSFQQAMLEAQKEMQDGNNSSDPPSPDMFSNSPMEDQIRIQSPDMKSIKQATAVIIAAHTPHVLDDRYMSSEEQLTPTENDSASSTGDVDIDDFADDEAEPDDWLEALFSEFTCKMATAICLIQVGKPRLVDIPVPSLTSSHTSSPSLSSEDGEKMPVEHVFTIPPRPKTPVRRRPVRVVPPMPLQPSLLRTKLVGASFASMSTPNVVSTYQPTTSSLNQRVGNVQTVETYVPTSAPNFLTVDPFAKSRPLIPTNQPPRISSHAGHSRLRNLSQKLLLPFNGSKVDLSETGSADIGEWPRKRKDSVASIQDTHTISRKRSMSFSHASSISTSAPKPNKLPKMVPRGASERAPTIEIPPCPDDLDLNFDTPAPHHPNKLRRRKSSVFRF
jgi:hypothetical protein